jgi:HEAT repeat protein
MESVINFLEVITALLDEEHPFPARFLHRFSDLSLVEAKDLKAIWKEIDPVRRGTLLTDLEEINDKDTLVNFESVALLGLKEVDPIARGTAIRLLENTDDRKVIPLFIALMHTDPDEKVRAEAAFALGNYVLKGELDKVPDKVYDDMMVHLLAVINGIDAPLVRRRALEAASYSCREEIPSLIQKAYAEKGKEWLVTALFSMGRSADPQWEKEVLHHLNSKDEDVQIEAIQAVGEIELKSASQPLLEKLENGVEDEDLKNAIVWSLSKIGEEGVRPTIEKMLEEASNDEEGEFLQEALDNLAFTEDMPIKEILEIKPPHKKDLDHIIRLEDEIEEEDDLPEDDDS